MCVFIRLTIFSLVKFECQMLFDTSDIIVQEMGLKTESAILPIIEKTEITAVLFYFIQTRLGLPNTSLKLFCVL